MAEYISRGYGCPRIGTDKQDAYASRLAGELGYSQLRNAVSDFTGWSVSKVAKKYGGEMPIREASRFIGWLKERLESSQVGQ